jgi:chemotaxis protein methyltransferase CheR
VQGSPILRVPRPKVGGAGGPQPGSPKPETSSASKPDPNRKPAVPTLASLAAAASARTASSGKPSAPTPLPPAPPVPAPAPPISEGDDMLRQALTAAREGKYDQAEALGREAARKLKPEAYLLLAMVAEARGDLNSAVDLVRKALYLDPQMALGHATLMTLYTRLNRREEAERARQNALRALDGLDDEHQLRGVETMTAGGLRQALAARNRSGWQGTH